MMARGRPLHEWAPLTLLLLRPCVYIIFGRWVGRFDRSMVYQWTSHDWLRSMKKLTQRRRDEGTQRRKVGNWAVDRDIGGSNDDAVADLNI